MKVGMTVGGVGRVPCIVIMATCLLLLLCLVLPVSVQCVPCWISSADLGKCGIMYPAKPVSGGSAEGGSTKQLKQLEVVGVVVCAGALDPEDRAAPGHGPQAAACLRGDGRAGQAVGVRGGVVHFSI